MWDRLLKFECMSIINALIFVFTSIYSLQVEDINGTGHSIGEFQGKKILVVNIATESSQVSQLAELQQLHQQFADSLVIIGCPSNSFGNESRTNIEIKQFCQSQYGVTFFLSSKMSIAGPNIQPV